MFASSAARRLNAEAGSRQPPDVMSLRGKRNKMFTQIFLSLSPSFNFESSSDYNQLYLT